MGSSSKELKVEIVTDVKNDEKVLKYDILVKNDDKNHQQMLSSSKIMRKHRSSVSGNWTCSLPAWRNPTYPWQRAPGKGGHSYEFDGGLWIWWQWQQFWWSSSLK